MTKMEPFEAQKCLDIILFSIVRVKQLKLVPDFIKTLNGTRRLKPNTFKAQNFALITVLYSTTHG